MTVFLGAHMHPTLHKLFTYRGRWAESDDAVEWHASVYLDGLLVDEVRSTSPYTTSTTTASALAKESLHQLIETYDQAYIA